MKLPTFVVTIVRTLLIGILFEFFSDACKLQHFVRITDIVQTFERSHVEIQKASLFSVEVPHNLKYFIWLLYTFHWDSF
jgi:hypothetical protein